MAWSSLRLHAGMGAGERAVETLIVFIKLNLVDKNIFAGNVNRALRVKRITIRTGLK